MRVGTVLRTLRSDSVPNVDFIYDATARRTRRRCIIRRNNVIFARRLLHTTSDPYKYCPFVHILFTYYNIRLAYNIYIGFTIYFSESRPVARWYRRSV